MNVNDLIGKGYFAKEIPPEFNSKVLGIKLDQLDYSNLAFKHRKWTKPVNFSVPKIRHSRRVLNVPTPYHQIHLAFYLSDKWEELNDFFDKSSLSLTKPVIGSEPNRAIDREYSFKEKSYRRIDGISKNKYILKTDISRYYPTIYTHSIPWALHGKQEAKNKMKDDSLTGNMIDKLIRYMQEGQTLGIPTGPDTSMVLSEIIGTAIDLKLQDSFSNLEGFRYTDDFELYFDTMSEAENGLNKLHSIVREYELELNPHKTDIIKTPDTIEPTWVPEIKLYNFREGKDEQRNDIISYFSRAFELSKKHENDGVLNYSVKRIPNLVHVDNWGILESLLLSTILVDSSTLPIVKNELLDYYFNDYPLNEEKILNTLSKIINENLKLGNDFEVLWALSICNDLKLKIPEKISKLLFEYENPLIAIMTLDAYQLGNIEKADLSFYKTLVNAENLYNSNWLFVYEAIAKEWIKPDINYVKEDKFYSQLLDLEVEFYNNYEWGEPLGIFDPIEY